MKLKNNRIFTIFIAIVMVVSLIVLSGCHEKYDLEQLAQEDEAENPEGYNSDSDDEELSEDSSDADIESDQDSDAQGEEYGDDDEETLPGTPPSTILGNRAESTYTNSYYGIKFTAPTDSWYIADDGELAQVMGIATSSIDDDEVLELLQNSGFVMDLYALDTASSEDGILFDNINITIEDIGKMYGVLFSEQELAEATQSTSVQALESQGWTNIDMSIDEAVFAGSPRVCTSTYAEMDGTIMYQKQVYIKKESYIACITVGSFGEDRTDTMLNAFSAL